jgi:hypothetical protein
MLSSTDFRSRLPKLWKAIDNEVIPSTRFFIEWFIILGLLKHGNSNEFVSFLNRLLEFNSSTGTAISLLTVAMHVGRKIEGEGKRAFFDLVFHRVLPWIMHNNHMVRLFALYVFDNLWLRTTTDQ